MKNPRLNTTYEKVKEALFSTELTSAFHALYSDGEDISSDFIATTFMLQAAIPNVKVDIEVNARDKAKAVRYVDTFNGVSIEHLLVLEEILRDLRIIYVDTERASIPPRKLFKSNGDVNPLYSRLASIYKTLIEYWDYLQGQQSDISVDEFDFYRLILAYAVKNTRTIPFSERAIADYLLEDGYNYAYRYLQTTDSMYSPYVSHTLGVYADLGSYVRTEIIERQYYQSRATVLTKEIIDRLIEKKAVSYNLTEPQKRELVNQNDMLIKETIKLCIRHGLSVFPNTKLAKERKLEGDVNALGGLELGFVLRNTAFSDFKLAYAENKAKNKKKTTKKRRT